MAHIVEDDSRVTVTEFANLSSRRLDVVLGQSSVLINEEKG